MGEYYIATLLDAAGRITRAVHPADYGISERLGAQTREGTPFLVAVETLLALDGGSRLVWAGDDAANEPGQDTNLYWAIQPHQFVRFEGLIDPEAGIEANTPRPPGAKPVTHEQEPSLLVCQRCLMRSTASYVDSQANFQSRAFPYRWIWLVVSHRRCKWSSDVGSLEDQFEEGAYVRVEEVIAC